MAREGIQNCDEIYLKSINLPEHADSYTVISHGYIIDKVKEELNKNNFNVGAEEYLYSYGGQVALAKIYIKSTKDPDMGMMLTWWNSYNKMVKFGCAIGAFIYDNKTSLIGSEGMSWIRKHTGSADQEASNVIEQLVSQADLYFDKIIAEKETMKAMPLSLDTFGCIMGALYFELDLISPNQASAIKNEYKKPQHEYKDKDTLWGLYKLLMFGIDGMDLRKWATSQQKLHHTIMNEYAIANSPLEVEPLNINPLVPIETPTPVAVESNQIVDEVNCTVEDESLTLTKEEVAYNLINEHGKDPAIVRYFCDEHFQNTLTLEQNVEAFFEYIKPKIKAEEIVAPVEILTPEVAKEKADKSDFVFPDDLDNQDKLNQSLLEDEITVEDLSPLPVESIETKVPEGFDWLLEDDIESVEDTTIESTFNTELVVPTEVKELANKIETKMKELYGEVKDYNYAEYNNCVLVTIDKTKEFFYVEN